jgi:hypothetical protein
VIRTETPLLIHDSVEPDLRRLLFRSCPFPLARDGASIVGESYSQAPLLSDQSVFRSEPRDSVRIPLLAVRGFLIFAATVAGLVRKEHKLDEKEIEFKDLRMGQLRRALPESLPNTRKSGRNVIST